jgi:hypothetical protein
MSPGGAAWRHPVVLSDEEFAAEKASFLEKH